jgi:hypothetical protein
VSGNDLAIGAISASQEIVLRCGTTIQVEDISIFRALYYVQLPRASLAVVGCSRHG